jgi:hypothetical protein
MQYIDFVQDTWKYITFIMVIFVVGGLILVYFFAINKNNLSKSSNEHMAQMYPTINPDLSSIDSEYNYPLFDYYIYSSFNSCSAGDYRDGVVSTDALLSVIRQGARFLDFQIFNENGEPVVATSTEKGNNYVKTSLNSISFGEVMNTVALNAFSDNAPNKSDPLIVHLRVMSNQVSIYDKIAEIFKQYDDRMLSASTSFADANTNFGLFPLHKARNKIIVFVDGSNNTYLQSDSFYEYVNMVSNSPFLWLLSNYDVVNYPNIEDLTNSNRTNMTIVTPNMGESSPTNPSILLAQEYGCQIVAMRFQEDDQYLQEANNFFKTSGQSFVLKPEELREKKVEIPDPVPQNPEYSYATREVKNNLYSFKY